MKTHGRKWRAAQGFAFFGIHEHYGRCYVFGYYRKRMEA